MSREALLLSQLEDNPGYKVLEQLWLEKISWIEEKRDSAAKRGSESAWRYWAGIEKGFKDATIQLKVSLAQMDQENDNERAEDRLRAIAQELKGEIPA